MNQANNQHIYFITGKGGVGKSTVALACAKNLAQKGLKTLLVEMNTHSYFARVLRQPVGHEPTQIEPSFYVANWTSENCLREYVLHYLKLERLFEIFFQNRVMRAFIDIAPGLSEISLLGKITSGIRKIGPPLEFDRIVVDCFSTGHALAFFRAPQGLAKAVQVGPMAEQSRAIDAILRDQRFCSYWLVTLLEELPTVETMELDKSLRADLGIEPTILSNRVLPKFPAVDLPAGAGGIAEFARDWKEQSEHQQHWYMKLHSQVEQITTLPFIYQSDAAEIFKSLATKVTPC